MPDLKLFHIVDFDSVTSTNDLVKQAIEKGSDEGLVVRAASQAGGYGRYGRSWSSPVGGLYMSVLLDPFSHVENAGQMAVKLPTLSLIVSLAVQSAIADIVGECAAKRIKIKWPNDVIYVSDVQEGPTDPPAGAMFQKLCGISLEKHDRALCIGIGVNISRVSADDASDCDNKPDPLSHRRNEPAYVSEIASDAESVSIGSVCEAILSNLEALYARWLAESFSAFRLEYNDSLALIGSIVRIEDGGRQNDVEGEVLGVDEHGCLMVKTADGSIYHISSGEAHVCLLGGLNGIV